MVDRLELVPAKQLCNGSGRQVSKAFTRQTNVLAEKLLARWETEILERCFHLPASKPSLFLNGR
jgi:hypothetical protein